MVTVQTDLAIRPANRDDADAILDLLRISLGEGEIPRSSEYWNWKHEANPFGASPGLVAEVDGQIVGLRVFMRWSWHVDGREVRAVRAVDTATHPEWRGRKIFSRLTLELVERLEFDRSAAFVFNTPNDRSRPGYLKMGWSSVGRMSLWIRPRRSWRMLRALVKTGGNEPGGIEDQDLAVDPALPSVARLLDEPELASFLAGSRDDGPRYSTRPTPEYLRWRYAKIPGFDYRAAWSWEDGGAAVIFRIKSRGDLRELRLCEILTDGESPHRAAALIRELIRMVPADYVAGMGAAGTTERQALLWAGFIPAPRFGPVLTVRPLALDSRDPDPLERSAWGLSIGDLELF